MDDHGHDAIERAIDKTLVLDSAWFRDWRRETSSDIREVRTRLTAIEAAMAEGSEIMARHGLQLAELATNVAEIDMRLAKLEEFRHRHEARCEDERERLRSASKAWHASAIKTAVNTAISFVVGGTITILIWLIANYLRANPPPGIKP